MTRSLLALFLAGALAACSSSSSGSTTSPHDAAAGHDGSDGLTATSYLTGTITSTDAPCVTAPIVSPGGAPACTMVEHLPADAGTGMNVPVPFCLDTNGAGPCFTIVATNGCAMSFAINYGTTFSPAATFSYSCQLCPTTGPKPDGC